MLDRAKSKLKSRKFWSFVIGGIVMILVNFVGLDPEIASMLTQSIVYVVLGYIFGEAFVDGLREFKAQQKNGG